MKENNKSNNIWTIGKVDEKKSEELALQLEISSFLASVLCAKGFDTAEKANDYLNCNVSGLCDPYLLMDMDRAIQRIKKALADGERIMIYGDYDVDGVTSVSVLLLYLRSKGADIDYYIPERINEGYGLNTAAVEKFAENGVKLIITVDSGITAHDEIDFAKSKGIDVVITDHHECREVLPDAVAVVNPHRSDSEYPFRDLAGVGVVFRLVCALEGKNAATLCSRFSDIVALGTVADVMPIVGENRIIVKLGLKALENTKNQGLSALIAQSFSERRNAHRKNLTANSIGFGIAPRINAAGRIGDVNKAVELLICDDKAKGENIATYLCNVNRERQLIENKIFEEAVSMIESTHDFDNDKIIVLTSDRWHLGVIGIVASKITERYKLPSILISVDGNVGKGSGRSVKGFNINEAISRCKDLLIKYGGHELAAGLTVEKQNIDEFRRKINAYAKSVFDFDSVVNYINADFEISTTDVTVEHAKELQTLEPFGLQNPVPIFCIKNALIKEMFSIGEGKHLKLMIEKDGCIITALYFGMPKDKFPFPEGSFADFMCNIDMNDFRGTLSVQALVKDVRMCESELREKEACEKLFDDILNSGKACPKEHIPTLNDFKASFMYLKRLSVEKPDGFEISVWRSAMTVNHDYGVKLSSLTLNIMLCVFDEMKLINIERLDFDNVRVSLNKTTGKVNLDESEFLIKLKSNI